MLLQVAALSAGYRDAHVIEEVDMCVETGELVAVVGPNGSGKTTLLRAIVGSIEWFGGHIFSGSIKLKGKCITGRMPHWLLKEGMAFVGEGGRLFPSMTVLENLEMGGRILRDSRLRATRVAEIIESFPLVRGLLHRSARSLSAGERQLVALGRALVRSPELLVLDEPCVGLSRDYIDRLFDVIQQILAGGRRSVLLVEQNLPVVLAHATRSYLMSSGRISSCHPVSISAVL